MKKTFLLSALMFMLAVVPNGLLAKDSPRSRSGKSSLRGGLTKRPKADIGSVVSQKTCEVPKGKFPWNFEKAKIVDIVDQVSRITCKNFILSSGVKANEEISILSRVPVTVDEAWKAFEIALAANNLANVPAGDFNKIVKRNDATRQAVPFYADEKKLPNDESMVTFLYEVKNTSRDVIRSLLKGLVGKEGEIDVLSDNIVVITDAASNIRRINKIMDKIDVSGGSNRIHMVGLTYADAVEAEKKLNEIFEPSGDKGSKSNRSAAARAALLRRGSSASATDEQKFSVHKIIADERTNKLLIIASDKAFEKIKEVLKMIDAPSSDGSAQGQVHVYALKNSDAVKIAKTLSSVTQSSSSNKRSSSSRKKDSSDSIFEGEVKITADEASNSLVIVANPRDYKSVMNVLGELDKPRAQVYIEAVIMDITVSDTGKFGLSAFGGGQVDTGDGKNMLLMSGNPGGSGLATGLAGALTGGLAQAGGFSPLLNTLGILGPTLDLPGGIKVPSFGLSLEMLKTYDDVDILSTPSIMTIDNEAAEMSVGEKVPILKGSSAVQGMTIPVQQTTYENIDLTFKVTPHIGDGDQLRLEIEQDANDIGQWRELTPGNKQPIINTKHTKTVVSVKDQQTVVISGLMSQTKSKTETKWPILGDIPLLGYFFKNTSSEEKKKNLVMVLTPYIVRDDEDFQKIYDRKMKQREELAKMYFGDKITKYDPFVDYATKRGPLTIMSDKVEHELQKAENGGEGLPGETVIKHEEKVPEVIVEPGESVNL